MCLGIPAQIVAGETGHEDLAVAEVGGVSRVVNVGLLDERPAPGAWILVHMGFALQTMTEQEAADAHGGTRRRTRGPGRRGRCDGGRHASRGPGGGTGHGAASGGRACTGR